MLRIAPILRWLKLAAKRHCLSSLGVGTISLRISGNASWRECDGASRLILRPACVWRIADFGEISNSPHRGAYLSLIEISQ